MYRPSNYNPPLLLISMLITKAPRSSSMFARSCKQGTLYNTSTCTCYNAIVDRIVDRAGCQWPSRSSKVNDFHAIWKSVCHFLLVINSNLGPISHHFWDMATYSLEHSIEKCGQTAADGDTVTINSLQEVVSALSDGTVADPYRLATIHPLQTNDGQTTTIP